MSSELRRWLADQLPEDMTSGDRLVLLELADWAHNETRLAYGDTLLPTLVRRTGLSERQIAKILAKVATQYGIEFRMPVKNADGTPKTDVLGRVVYAYKGHQTTYRIPQRLSWGAPIDGAQREPHEAKAVPQDHNGRPVGPQRLNPRTTKAVPQDTPTPEVPPEDPSPTSEEIYIPTPSADQVGREGPAEEQRRSDALGILERMDFGRGVKRYESGGMVRRLADKLAGGWSARQLYEAIDTGWNGAHDRVAVTNGRIDTLPDHPPRPRPGTPMPPPVAPPDYANAAAPESASRYADIARAGMRGAGRV